MHAEATAQLHEWMESGLFNMSEAQVLDYWLDDSLASHYKVGHQLPLEFQPEVVAEDARFYHGDVGFGSITCFAAWLNQTYVREYGQPPFRAYGQALCPPPKRALKTSDGGAVRRSWQALATLATAALTATPGSDGKVVAVWSDIEGLGGGLRPLDPHGPSPANAAREPQDS